MYLDFSHVLKVIPYYGSVDEREELKAVLYEEEYDVVVTTYNLAVGKTDSVFLQSMNFNVIVYDEGHMLKNAMSDRYKRIILQGQITNELVLLGYSLTFSFSSVLIKIKLFIFE